MYANDMQFLVTTLQLIAKIYISHLWMIVLNNATKFVANIDLKWND